jgi:formylglycine-generating enzyme required for sulfatase activity
MPPVQEARALIRSMRQRFATMLGTPRTLRALPTVGEKTPNAFGLYDMPGNAWEWVEDCYHDSYTAAPSDGSAWIEDGCKGRVTRGGSFKEGPAPLCSAYRRGGPANNHFDDLGFRVGRTLLPP